MKNVMIAGLVTVVIVVVLPFGVQAVKKGNTPATPDPQVVLMEPANGAQGVSPGLERLTVTFDRQMGGGFSWTGGGPEMPEGAGKPYWEANGKTCVLPVRLQPNHSYRLGLNSPSHKNFKAQDGTPLRAVEWRFTTGS